MGTFVTQDARLLPVKATPKTKQSEAPKSVAPLAIAAQQLVQLNLQFLTLPTIDSGLPDPFGASIRGMSTEQRLSIADCRFSLFTLAFNDGSLWHPLLNRSAADLASRSVGPLTIGARGNDSRIEFVVAAVFLAWHLVQSDVLAAKFLLNIDDAIAAALKSVPIAHLLALSVEACDWLAPRWPNHPSFWPTLLHPRCDSTSDRVATKWLGRQLLAAESLSLLRALPVSPALTVSDD
jgi:hypothetical protein